MPAQWDARFLTTGGLLFVYGTLQSGEEADDKMGDATYLGKAQTSEGYRVVPVPRLGKDAYALEKGGDDCVNGELYLATPDVLKKLDAWEDQYHREFILLADGRVVDAYMLR